MHFELDRCPECGNLRLPVVSKFLQQDGSFKSGHKIGFCSDACFLKALRPYLPPVFADYQPSNKHKYFEPVTQEMADELDWFRRSELGLPDFNERYEALKK